MSDEILAEMRGAGGTGRTSGPAIGERLAALDWQALEASLWEHGHAVTPPLLTAEECEQMAGLFGDDDRFRSRIVMERYRFGAGEYGYFAEPLPPLIRDLRGKAYKRLAPVANRWAEALGEERRFPKEFKDYSALCNAAGQQRPTPLLLHYTEGGYNRLHQDLYGELRFPFQIACCLSRSGRDYEGGAFLLVENQPRQQSRGEALLPEQGALVIFPTSLRPVRGKRGWLRAKVRHGVSRITRGERYTLGIVFHNAR